MWQCSDCGESVEDHLINCPNCEPDNGSADPEVVPENPAADDDEKSALSQVLELQTKQLETLRVIQRNVGCLYNLMVAWTILSMFALLINLIQSR